MKRRILYVITSTTVGGAERTLERVATGLDRSRFEVAGVVSLKPEGAVADRLKAAGIPVTTLNQGRVPMPWDPLRLAAAIDAAKPDIVHAFLYRAVELTRLARPFAKDFKLVSSFRVHFRSRPALLHAVDAALRGKDDLNIAESESSARDLVSRMGYPADRVSVILNGVDADALEAKPGERAEARRLLGLKDTDFLVGSVGRVDVQKGHEFLVEAARRLAPRRPDLKVAVIGDGPLLEELGAATMRDGLHDRVWFLGQRTDLRAWLAAMDAFCLPSLWEGVPNAALEAMAAGLPVVATRVDGVEEAVTDERTGLLVEPRSADALASAIGRLMDEPDLRARLGSAGKDDVRRRFTMDRMLLQYEGAYARL